MTLTKKELSEIRSKISQMQYDIGNLVTLVDSYETVVKQRDVSFIALQESVTAREIDRLKSRKSRIEPERLKVMIKTVDDLIEALKKFDGERVKPATEETIMGSILRHNIDLMKDVIILKRTLKNVRKMVDLQECREDEDCDHCVIIREIDDGLKGKG